MIQRFILKYIGLILPLESYCLRTPFPTSLYLPISRHPVPSINYTLFPYPNHDISHITISTYYRQAPSIKYTILSPSVSMLNNIIVVKRKRNPSSM